MQLFEATFVRSLLTAKNLEHGKFKEWYHVKEERLLYRSLHSENYVTFTLTTWNRVVFFMTNIQNQKIANYFSDVVVSGPTA